MDYRVATKCQLIVLSMIVAASIGLGACTTTQSTTSNTSSEALLEKAERDSTILAVWDGTVLRIEDFERIYKNSPHTPDSVQGSAQRYEDFLNRYVNTQLKLRDARDRGINENPEVRRELSKYRSDLARQHLVDARVDSLLRDLYDKQQEVVHFGLITRRIPEPVSPKDTLKAYRTIEAIADSIRRGASFIDMMKKHSTEFRSPTLGDSLYVMPVGQAAKSFEDQVYSTPVAEMSPIFRVGNNYHIVKVYNKRPAVPKRLLRHIVIRPKSEQPTDTLDAYRMAQRLRDSLIHHNANMAELAKQYSADPMRAPQGGQFPRFLSKKALEQDVPNFANEAFRLDSTGAISNIIRTRFGYHVIRVDSIQPIPSFQEAQPQLRRTLKPLERGQNLERKVTRDVRNELGVRLDTAVVRRAAASLPEANAWPSLHRTGFTSGYGDSVFAAVGDSLYRLNRLQPRLTPEAPESIEDRLLIRADQFITEQAFHQKALALEESDPTFRELMEQQNRGTLLFRITREMIWDPARHDTTALQAYFKANKDEFRLPERRRVLHIRTGTSHSAQRVIRNLEEGLSPEQLATDPGGGSLNIRVDTTVVGNTTHPVLKHAQDLQTGEHTTSDSLHYEGEYHVLAVLETLEPRLRTFEEAYRDVVDAYRRHLERQWVQRLRKQYNLHLFPDRLRYAFDDAGRNASETTGVTGLSQPSAQ